MDPSIKLLPNHICIPMDGNGRWAKNRELSRSFGHKAGVEVVKKISRSCAHLGVKYLTLWAFSTENWSRPASEVSFLMRLLESVLRDEISSLIKDKVRLRVIGQRSRIPKSLVKMIVDAEEQTSIFSDFNLTIAVDYGGRDDICNATKMIAEKVKAGLISTEEITQELFSAHLYTDGLPDPDLFIRPGGVIRLSNYLLWQMAYTEMYFTDTLWPDFSEKDLHMAIEYFRSVERRFGGLSAA